MSPKRFGLLLAAGSLFAWHALAQSPKPIPAPLAPPAKMTHTHTNLLAKEHSPYLLQHQHNPVDWQPWGETAFAQARREDKPILLSIGYSTCHWCHVMERESFEDPKLAEYLNAHFISIKVDREERPDVDKIYMTAVQAMGLGGGWPLNAFLTPDLKPFYGGTYFPPEPRQGRPSFLQLLQRIHELWTTKRQDLNSSADGLHSKLAQHLQREAPANAVFLARQLQQAARLFKGEYDPANGGFGGAPKFPRVSQPYFLLHYGANYQDQEAVKMVLQTCEKMAAGGINDQLGGGFARYSVDAEWLVPHFEKMLYDNAQLLGLYLDASNLSTNPVFAATARHIVDYVLRDMTDPEGGFYSAEDADSEGKEGKFYCWTQSELAALLSPAEFKVAVKYFGITEHGNFLDHSDPNPLPNQNVLSIVSPALTDNELQLLNEAKKKMLKERTKRIRPHLDDKVLASWNGLMLGALARAAVILDHPAAAAAAQKNLSFIRTKLWDTSTQTLHNRWRKGHRDEAQILDAYSFLLTGVIDLYETTLNPDTLAFAIDLADAMLKRFYDSELGGFWQAPKGAKDLILNVKEDYDGAEPSGNSTAAYALLRLAAITERKDYRDAAEKTLKLFYERCQQAPQILPLMLHAWDFSLKDPRRAVINGEYNSPEVKALLKAIHTSPGGHRVVLGTSGPVEPFAKTLPAGKPPKAFVCTGNACLQPTSDPDTIRKNLR